MLERSALRRRGRPLAVLLALGIVGCSTAPPPGDVVLITVDTLRPDHLGIYGYERATTPKLDAWFARGTVFERAYSAAASTPPGVVSILTGLLPQQHQVRTFYQFLPDAIETLPELLSPVYQSAAFVSNSVLADEAIGLADRFDHYDDAMGERVEAANAPFAVERSARATSEAALAWLRAERDPKRPLLLWVHYMDPHGPYDPPEPWRERFHHQKSKPVETERIQPYQRKPGVSDALVYVDQYDGEIAYVDAEIGRLLEGYAQSPAAETALFVFTADHGETLMERREWFRHGYHVFQEIIRVPLLIRGPGVAASRRREPVSTTAIVPTLLHHAGKPGSGVDLRRQGSSAAVVFAEADSGAGQWRAAIQGDRKLLVHVPLGERRPARRGMFDLASDPGERRPLRWPANDPTGRELLELIRRDPDPGGLPVSNPAAGRRRGAPALDADALERLRRLGYVE